MKRQTILALLILIGVLMSSCQPAPGDEAPAPETDRATRPPGTPLLPSAPPPDAEATDLMRALSGRDAAKAQAAIDEIVAARDTRFVGVFIELLRADQIGLVQNVSSNALIGALQTLSGQTFGWDWPAWIEWYGGADLTVPPGFTGWKGQLLARIDPGFGEFLRDDLPSRIRVEEIQWGGCGWTAYRR